jgi:hypothetical protein
LSRRQRLSARPRTPVLTRRTHAPRARRRPRKPTPHATPKPGDADDDDEGSDDDAYSDDEDASWKVRRAAAKLVSALVAAYPDALSEIYARCVVVEGFNGWWGWEGGFV